MAVLVVLDACLFVCLFGCLAVVSIWFWMRFDFVSRLGLRGTCHLLIVCLPACPALGALFGEKARRRGRLNITVSPFGPSCIRLRVSLRSKRPPLGALHIYYTSHVPLTFVRYVVYAHTFRRLVVRCVTGGQRGKFLPTFCHGTVSSCAKYRMVSLCEFCGGRP